jgi:hypothetical protein
LATCDPVPTEYLPHLLHLPSPPFTSPCLPPLRPLLFPLGTLPPVSIRSCFGLHPEFHDA